jgi:hypothetical protein
MRGLKEWCHFGLKPVLNAEVWNCREMKIWDTESGLAADITGHNLL